MEDMQQNGTRYCFHNIGTLSKFNDFSNILCVFLASYKLFSYGSECNKGCKDVKSNCIFLMCSDKCHENFRYSDFKCLY